MLTATPSPSLPLWPSPPSPPTPPSPTSIPRPLPAPHHSNGEGAATPLLAVTSNDLTYRGEGADHVVLGLRKLGQVLRLRKTYVDVSASREELLTRAERDLEVLSKVGRALLGRLLTDAAHVVLVSPRPDSALSDVLRPWRTRFREKKEINKHVVACICPDATTIFIPRQDTPTSPLGAPLTSTPIPGRLIGGGREARNVCIEIKPKQGFLDRSTPALPLCRYCVKQFLKAGKEKGSRSGYCPLDLFSGNLDRMRRAVDNLILSPQNNFKVFVDGEPVKETKAFQYLRDTIISALTYTFSGQTTVTSRLDPRSPLGRILAFQNLDRLGVFRASRLYLTLCDLLMTPEAVDKALYDLSAWPSPALDLTAQEEEEQEEGRIEVMIRLLQSYLLSTTAKDLSLMILLSGPYYSPPPHYTASTSPFIVPAEGGAGWFQCQVTGVDIVAKPTSKILKHQRDYERLRDVLKELRTRGEEPSCCRT